MDILADKKCTFQYRVARFYPKQCEEKALPDSEYCIWHDKRPKQDYAALASKLEEAITKKNLSTEGFSLRYAQLRGLTLHRTGLIGVDFEKADLTRARLPECDLSHAIFRNANLRGADLTECHAEETDFQGACLDEVNFLASALENANFEYSSYRGANFTEAYLQGTLLYEVFGKTDISKDRILKQFMPNPFTPKAGLLPRWFGDRDAAKHSLISALVQASTGLPDHVVVLGEWAMGKTALLLWFKGEAQYRDIWASYVPVPLLDESTTVIETTSSLVEGISHGFAMGVSSLKTFLRTVNQFGFSIAGTGVSLSRKIDMQPTTLLSETFQSLWDDLSARTKCVILLFDDIHQIRPGKQVLSVLKQSLTQMTATSQARILIVMSATPGEWLSLVGAGGHTPVGRYFSSPPIELTKLSDSEVAKVIEKTLEGTDVTFSPPLIRRIQEFAKGHPYDLQIICKILYDAQLGGTVQEAVWDKSKTVAEQWLQRIATKREQVTPPIR